MNIPRREFLLGLLSAGAASQLACGDKWLSTALSYLPLATDMAVNLGNLASVLLRNQQLSQPEADAIRNLSAEAQRDLALLRELYNEFQAHQSADALGRIKTALDALSLRLPTLLGAVRIQNAVIAARIGMAVNLLQAVITNLAELLPALRQARAGRQPEITLPAARTFKSQWNKLLTAPVPGDLALTTALQTARLR